MMVFNVVFKELVLPNINTWELEILTLTHHALSTFV